MPWVECPACGWRYTHSSYARCAKCKAQLPGPPPGQSSGISGLQWKGLIPSSFIGWVLLAIAVIMVVWAVLDMTGQLPSDGERLQECERLYGRTKAFDVCVRGVLG